MAQYFEIHPENPQPRILQQAAAILRDGGIVAVPTDSCYSLVCHTGDKHAMEKLRGIRGVDDRHHFTLLCSDLASIGHYARVDNATYRLLKSVFPGGYTVILEGTKDLPRRLLHPKRRTIGVRIPNHPVVLGLLDVFGEPLLGTTLILPGEARPLTDGRQIQERLAHDIDLVLDAGHCGGMPTTVVDLSGERPELLREGKGALSVFGL
jgi:tRNA threonylcarbamoyl adenosine modification protein (Sua5/YciO/YrdC/YwlC family)